MSLVRELQSVDTSGVEPLRAISDETEEGMRERTIGLSELREALDQEVVFGFRKRPRRIRNEADGEAAARPEGEWDPLATAPRRGGPGGRYFIVETERKAVEQPTRSSRPRI